jgi:hypothetical protein
MSRLLMETYSIDLQQILDTQLTWTLDIPYWTLDIP